MPKNVNNLKIGKFIAGYVLLGKLFDIEITYHVRGDPKLIMVSYACMAT